MKMLIKLRYVSFLFIIFYFILFVFSCGKKTVDNPLTNTSAGSTSPRSGARIQVTAPEPPAIISEDLTVPENGVNIDVISASDYNSLDYKEQIIYTGLRNAIAYLFENATNEATVMQYNVDGSYTIVSNPDQSDDENSDSTRICVNCGYPMASLYRCMQRVGQYMEDNNKTRYTVKINKYQTQGVQCIQVIYHFFGPAEQTTTDGGTVEETFTPGIPPTFTDQQYDSFIQTTILWYSSAHPPVPLVWTAMDLYPAIDAFVNEELSPSYDVYSYATQQGFITSLKSYVSAHY